MLRVTNVRIYGALFKSAEVQNYVPRRDYKALHLDNRVRLFVFHNPQNKLQLFPYLPVYNGNVVCSLWGTKLNFINQLPELYSVRVGTQVVMNKRRSLLNSRQLSYLLTYLLHGTESFLRS